VNQWSSSYSNSYQVAFSYQESGVRSQELGVRSQELGVRSQELGVRSQELGVRSQESGVKGKPVTTDTKLLVLVVSRKVHLEGKIQKEKEKGKLVSFSFFLTPFSPQDYLSLFSLDCPGMSWNCMNIL